MSWLTAGVGSVIGGLLGIGGSALGSQDKTTTVKTTLPPELQGAQNTDLSTLTNILNSPSAGLAPVQSAAQDQINTAYKGLPQSATQQLASRGFGSSGQVGNAVYDTEGARLGAQSNLYGQIAQLASNRQLSASQIMEQIIAAGRGTSTTTPGNVAGNALTTGSNAFTNFATLQTLQQMLNGAGSTPSNNAPYGTGPAPGETYNVPNIPGYDGTGYV